MLMFHVQQGMLRYRNQIVLLLQMHPVVHPVILNYLICLEIRLLRIVQRV